MAIDETIEKTLKELKAGDRALATHTHQLNMAAVTGFDALGYDENGRLKLGRFDKTEDGKEGDGAKTVGDAANKYMNGIISARINGAIDGNGNYDAKKLAPDEAARLQGGGYFGVTAKEISNVASQLKENFTPEALKKNFEKEIGRVRKVIRESTLTQGDKLDREEVLKYVGLTKENPLYEKVKVDDIKADHLLTLIDIYRQEKAITEPTLKQIGLYK